MKKEARRPCAEIPSLCFERKDVGIEFMENRADAGDADEFFTGDDAAVGSYTKTAIGDLCGAYAIWS